MPRGTLVFKPTNAKYHEIVNKLHGTRAGMLVGHTTDGHEFVTETERDRVVHQLCTSPGCQCWMSPRSGPDLTRLRNAKPRGPILVLH